MKKTKLFLGVALITVVLSTSCGEPKETEKVTTITTISYNPEDTLVDKSSRIQSDAHSGQFVYRTDSTHEYAGTQSYLLNDSLVNSSLRVVVNYWARTSNPLTGDGFAASLQDNNAVAYWATFEYANHGIKPNEWTNIIDSVTIPSENNNARGLFFKFFAFNPNKKSVFELDDISITIKKVEKVVVE